MNTHNHYEPLDDQLFNLDAAKVVMEANSSSEQLHRRKEIALTVAGLVLAGTTILGAGFAVDHYFASAHPGQGISDQINGNPNK